MIKFAVQQWDKNKHKLEEEVRLFPQEYNRYSYKDLVAKVVELIFNEEDSYDDEFDFENITQIDNGDYQGTLLYLIPFKSYQPSESEYLMTFVGYGSCSGCDTLEGIQVYYWDEEDVDQLDEFVNDMMSLCLHLVQNTIRPYNHGWRASDEYNQIGDDNNA